MGFSLVGAVQPNRDRRRLPTVAPSGQECSEWTHQPCLANGTPIARASRSVCHSRRASEVRGEEAGPKAKKGSSPSLAVALSDSPDYQREQHCEGDKQNRPRNGIAVNEGLKVSSIARGIQPHRAPPLIAVATMCHIRGSYATAFGVD
jgi:hypothetical protein